MGKTVSLQKAKNFVELAKNITPGPWKIEEMVTDTFEFYDIYNKHGLQVCEVCASLIPREIYPSSKEAKANSTFIVESPEMVEVIEALTDLVECYHETLARLSEDIDGIGDQDLHELAFEAARDRDPSYDGTTDPTPEDYVVALVRAVTGKTCSRLDLDEGNSG